jgi:hypothetical protein
MYLLRYRSCFWVYFSWWHDVKISAMLVSMFSISGIPILGRPPSWCTLKFTDCFDVSHSTVHTHGWTINFNDTNFVKRELAGNTLRKMKSVKSTLPNAIKTWCSWLTAWLNSVAQSSSASAVPAVTHSQLSWLLFQVFTQLLSFHYWSQNRSYVTTDG